MGSPLTTLTTSDIERFGRDGYVVVRQAFSRDDGLAMEARWWRELEDIHGIRRDDRSSWHQIVYWGRSLVTFPEPGAWDVPARHWHWDNPTELHLGRPRALFVVSFIGPVGPRGGGTLILSGSPRLLIQQERRMPPTTAAIRSPGPGNDSTALTPGSGRSPDWRRRRPTGPPLSWAGKPPSMACLFAWSN